MKKGFIISVIIAGVLTFALVPVVAIGQVVRNSAIGEENALNFACVDAGVLPEYVEDIKTKFDYREGSFAYEVEFVSDNVEYEYLVKSSNGAILAKDVKYPTQSIQSETDAYTDVENSMKTEVISLDRAKEMALSEAGLTSDQVVFKKVALEKDDGTLVYDIEFYVKNVMSYEFEIDAYSGAILEEKNEVWQTADNKVHDHSTNTGVNTGLELIGPDRAKEIALSKAGLDSDTVVFNKVKLEHDDGRRIYDIEFFIRGEYEYEFEIDAYTGAIIEEEIERWEKDD